MSRHLDSNSAPLRSHISHAVNPDTSKKLDIFYQMQVVTYNRGQTSEMPFTCLSHNVSMS